ncbi:MAG TPA: alpha-E domain-containing protein, partial [Hyphomicrobium sp.]|nr:alpha-E domain-containing protein [Hyphomicrobium sp.]
TTNPSSIATCLASARQNGRAQRTALTRDMWESLNSAWLEFSAIKPGSVTSNSLPDLLDWIRSRSALYRGSLMNTILRNDTYSFSQLGTFIERADSTSRILDVKYYHLLPSTEMVGSGTDNFQWTSILRSVSAHRSYRWVFKDSYKPWKIADYLILNRQMPRSLRSCYDELNIALNDLGQLYGRHHPCHGTAAATRDLLIDGDIKGIFQTGLHEFVQDFIGRNNKLGTEISQAYHFTG